MLFIGGILKDSDSWSQMMPSSLDFSAGQEIVIQYYSYISPQSKRDTGKQYV